MDSVFLIHRVKPHIWQGSRFAFFAVMAIPVIISHCTNDCGGMSWAVSQR